MSKVIFLDIDGVLNTGWWYSQMDRDTPKDKYGYAFDPILEFPRKASDRAHQQHH